MLILLQQCHNRLREETMFQSMADKIKNSRMKQSVDEMKCKEDNSVEAEEHKDESCGPVWDDIPKEDVGKYNGKYDIVLVDGNYIRQHGCVDFIGGGHHSVYSWIPENILAVEDMKNPKDIAPLAVHEGTEKDKMDNENMDYDTAHDEEANPAEEEVRKEINNSEGEASINPEKGMPSAADFKAIIITKKLKGGH